MSLEVLQSSSQNREARQQLARIGASCIDSRLVRILNLRRIIGGVSIGDLNKSWDVLLTVKFALRHLAKEDPILDIGCYASEALLSLHKLGFFSLHGADLNPQLAKMPLQRSIRYEISNFMHTPFDNESFSAVISTSVIEHGFDGPALLKEVSRLLRPGGYFVASFDYWPHKLDTTGIELFGMSWTIFSKQEITEFIDLAANYQLIPIGDQRFEARDAPIKYGGNRYTFGWLALEKTHQT